MTLKELLEIYKGNACISIDGYCEEEEYDNYWRNPWWDEIKGKKVTEFTVIGGGCYNVELCILIAKD